MKTLNGERAEQRLSDERVETRGLILSGQLLAYRATMVRCPQLALDGVSRQCDCRRPYFLFLGCKGCGDTMGMKDVAAKKSRWREMN